METRKTYGEALGYWAVGQYWKGHEIGSVDNAGETVRLHFAGVDAGYGKSFRLDEEIWLTDGEGVNTWY